MSAILSNIVQIFRFFLLCSLVINHFVRTIWFGWTFLVEYPPRFFWMITFFSAFHFVCSSTEHFGYREHSIISSCTREPKHQYDMPCRWISSTKNYLETVHFQPIFFSRSHQRISTQFFVQTSVFLRSMINFKARN